MRLMTRRLVRRMLRGVLMEGRMRIPTRRLRLVKAEMMHGTSIRSLLTNIVITYNNLGFIDTRRYSLRRD